MTTAMEHTPTEPRFVFYAIEMAEWKLYAVGDKETNKTICHLLPENGADFCKEYGNKITNFLNSPDPSTYITELNAEVERLKKLVAKIPCMRCKKSPATKDYNGHGHLVCDHCFKMLEEEFEDEYK